MSKAKTQIAGGEAQWAEEGRAWKKRIILNAGKTTSRSLPQAQSTTGVDSTLRNLRIKKTKWKKGGRFTAD